MKKRTEKMVVSLSIMFLGISIYGISIAHDWFSKESMKKVVDGYRLIYYQESYAGQILNINTPDWSEVPLEHLNLLEQQQMTQIGYCQVSQDLEEKL